MLQIIKLSLRSTLFIILFPLFFGCHSLWFFLPSFPITCEDFFLPARYLSAIGARMASHFILRNAVKPCRVPLCHLATDVRHKWARSDIRESGFGFSSLWIADNVFCSLRDCGPAKPLLLYCGQCSWTIPLDVFSLLFVSSVLWIHCWRSIFILPKKINDEAKWPLIRRFYSSQLIITPLPSLEFYCAVHLSHFRRCLHDSRQAPQMIKL